MPLNDSVVEAVTNANFKNIGEMGSITAGVASQNLVSHNRAMDQLREAFLAESTLSRAGNDPTEAIANAKTISSDLASQISNLAASVAAIQQYVKAAQTTPPVTP